MPLVTSSVNVKFNGTLEDAVVLKNASGVRTVILWNNLSAADKATLTSFVNQYGGDAPLAAPVAGFARVNFSGSVVGANATGLSAQATSTAGTATINVGSNKVVGTSSGLSTAVGTAGYHAINLAPGVVGTTATGLANNATAYTLTVTVDGVSRPVSVVGSAAQTYTALVTEINADLGANATASLSGGDIKITSATFGSSSTVRITGGTMLAALTAYQGTFAPVSGENTGRTYSATVVVDGTKVKSVRFAGTSGTTFGNVISEINADLGADATAAISGGNIVITSATTGTSSSVRVYDTGLFASLAGYTSIAFADGVAPKTYTATVVVDGVARPISIVGSAAQTFTTLVTELNADLGAAATAAISGGNIVITSATTGTSSSVVVSDVDLFKSLAGFVSTGASVRGIADLVDAMKATVVGGSTLFSLFDVKVVGAKPARPVVPAVLPKTPEYTYFDGTAWKYLQDDTNVNP